jgi:alpha-L-fucosidase
MVQELMSQYGDLAIVWFDGGAHGPEKGGPDVLSIFEKYQSSCLFYHNLQRADMRWGGSESGTVPYPCWGTYAYPSWFASRGDDIGFRPIKYGDPAGHFYMPAMSDAPLRGFDGRHEWFWEPNDEAHIYPLAHLVNMYYRSVGHNSTLVLGLTPNEDGLMPSPDVDRLREFGNEIKRRFSDPIVSLKGHERELIAELPKNQIVNQIVLREDISRGERVRKFRMEGKTDEGWRVLNEGSCIGHKYIALFEAVELSSLRLIIEDCIGQPSILEFSVYHCVRCGLE